VSAVRDPGETARREWQPSRALVGVVLVLAATSYVYLGWIAVWPYVARPESDFVNYFQAARAIVEGRSPFSVPGFDYPPLLAIVVLPLVPLGLEGARWAWFCLGHACLLAAAGLMWRKLGADRAALLAVALVWGVGGTIAENLALGQLNPLLLVLVVLSVGSVRGGAVPSSAIGVATALKLWPGVLLVRDAITGSLRRSLQAALITLGLVVVPMLGVATLLPPPSSPPHAGYWMGTPALNNLSFPGTVLRILDAPKSGAALPQAWIRGNDPAWLVLSVQQRVVSVGVAVIGLALGLILVFVSLRRRGAAQPDPALLTGALVALALAWAPLCWYHYRLLHFVGAAAICSGGLRRRRWSIVGATFLALVVATWTALAMDRLYIGVFGWTAAVPTALWLLTSIVPFADLTLAVLCVHASFATMHNERRSPAAATARRG
jgi:hypothetical protein